MTPEDYKYLCRFVASSSGLTLGPNKQYLLNARLLPVAHSRGLKSISELVGALRAGEPGLATAAVEAMTTNETLFFRDRQPFEDLRNVILPRLNEERSKATPLRIWCAAASTGQEPYSLAMLLAEHFPQYGSGQAEILATDLNSAALKRAAEGVYSQFEVQRGLPIRLLMKYLEQVERGWRIKDELRSIIEWRRLNLLDGFIGLGQFDVILCRNVLIYFDTEVKQQILQRLCQRLHPHGYLILGAAETVLGMSTPFARFSACKSAVYRFEATPAATTLGSGRAEDAFRSPIKT
jgi:chemotaxis protein methyltransferase CheR